jgi:TPR repeat protein
MRSSFRPLILALTLLATTVPNAGAQGSQQLLDEVRLLTPYTLRDLVDVAESGDTLAQFKVGLAYYYGYAVRALPEEAARWFRRAAEHGCVAAQHMLGVQLRDGNGVAQDAGEALRLLRAAADRGYPDAQYDYGLMLFDGNGVEQNQTEAYSWFSSAAAGGSVEASTFMGIMLVNGLGVDRNPAEGREALLRAARAGSPMAQANLGALYANGVGVEQSATEALIWFYMAEAGGFEEVGPLIADMTQSMSESEVAELRREAQQRTERLLAELTGDTPVEDDTPHMDDAEVAAALRTLGEWLVPQLSELGTFNIGVSRDMGGGSMRRRQGPTVRGSSAISEVSLDGCRLRWAAVTVLTEQYRWEWSVDLGTVTPARLEVLPWELPEGWRVASGQVHAVYLRTPEEGPEGHFTNIDPNGRTGSVWEVSIPLRDRSAADAVLEKLREAVQLCARR